MLASQIAGVEGEGGRRRRRQEGGGGVREIEGIKCTRKEYAFQGGNGLDRITDAYYEN